MPLVMYSARTGSISPETRSSTILDEVEESISAGSAARATTEEKIATDNPTNANAKRHTRRRKNRRDWDIFTERDYSKINYLGWQRSGGTRIAPSGMVPEESVLNRLRFAYAKGGGRTENLLDLSVADDAFERDVRFGGMEVFVSSVTSELQIMRGFLCVS